MSEQKETLNFPTCAGCKFYYAGVDYGDVKVDWKCLNPHKGCYNRLKFFEGLVAALQNLDLKQWVKDNLLQGEDFKEEEYENDAIEYANIIAVFRKKVLMLLGAKEEEHSPLCRVMKNLYPEKEA